MNCLLFEDLPHRIDWRFCLAAGKTPFGRMCRRDRPKAHAEAIGLLFRYIVLRNVAAAILLFEFKVDVSRMPDAVLTDVRDTPVPVTDDLSRCRDGVEKDLVLTLLVLDVHTTMTLAFADFIHEFWT
ncbi:hypothetical protein ACU8L5_17035 [Rhizobium leguminosarum]